MFENDPEFRKLKADFERAKNAYEIAIQHRLRLRAMFDKKQAEKQSARRPIGTPADYVFPPAGNFTNPTGGQKPKPYRAYLGEILGWVKYAPAEIAMPQNDQSVDYDAEKIFDQISLSLYWNAKVHYLRCKEALEKYVPKERYVREEIKSFNDHAIVALNKEATRQLWGLETAEANMETAQRQVDEACKVALAYYQSSPSPKSRKVIIILLENLADSQFVGLESETINKMMTELEILQNEGLIDNG
jgi:hypothetical protein